MHVLQYISLFFQQINNQKCIVRRNNIIVLFYIFFACEENLCYLFWHQRAWLLDNHEIQIV